MAGSGPARRGRHSDSLPDQGAAKFLAAGSRWDRITYSSRPIRDCHRGAVIGFAGIGLNVERQSQSTRDLSQIRAAHPPRRFDQLLEIEGHDLRDVRYRVLRQTGDGGWQHDVSGRVHEIEIRGNAQRNRRSKAAAIEWIGLDDYHGSAKSGLRADRFA